MNGPVAAQQPHRFDTSGRPHRSWLDHDPRYTGYMRVALSVLTLLALCACGGMQSAPATDNMSTSALPAALSQRVAIDGRNDFGIFAQIEATELTFTDFIAGVPTGTTQLRWGITNDDRDAYLAFEWTDGTLDNAFDGALGPIQFDGIQAALRRRRRWHARGW